MRFCFASAAFAAGLSAALSIAAPAASAQTAPLNPRVALKVGAIGAVSDAGIFIAQARDSALPPSSFAATSPAPSGTSRI
jgi:hypothetical protein